MPNGWDRRASDALVVGELAGQRRGLLLEVSRAHRPGALSHLGHQRAGLVAFTCIEQGACELESGEQHLAFVHTRRLTGGVA